MEAEHCSMVPFVTGKKNRMTSPAKEWGITVRGDYTSVCWDSNKNRELHTIEKLLKKDVVKQAKLARHEVIAVVLYTGPMVSRMQW